MPPNLEPIPSLLEPEPKRDSHDSIREVEFLRDKYGPELLVDVGWITELEKFNTNPRPHRLHFYDVLLITRGVGTLGVDGTQHTVEPGRLLFTSPGQVRRFAIDDSRDSLEGICFFFVGEFIEVFFNDPLFLFRMQFFHREDTTASLAIPIASQAWLLERLETMRHELHHLRGDSPHLLRAVLYEVLVTINRWWALEHGTHGDTQAHPTVYQFLLLLQKHLHHEHRVSAYARRLGVSPGHLSALCRKALGRSAGRLIQARLLAEAKRQLLYSPETAANIALSAGV